MRESWVPSPKFKLPESFPSLVGFYYRQRLGDMRRFYNAECPSETGGGVTPDTPMTTDDFLACWATMGARAVRPLLVPYTEIGISSLGHFEEIFILRMSEA